MDCGLPVFGPGPVIWVGLLMDGNQQVAAVGQDLEVGCAGFGPTIPAALRELACPLEAEGVELGPLAQCRVEHSASGERGKP